MPCQVFILQMENVNVSNPQSIQVTVQETGVFTVQQVNHFSGFQELCFNLTNGQSVEFSADIHQQYWKYIEHIFVQQRGQVKRKFGYIQYLHCRLANSPHGYSLLSPGKRQRRSSQNVEGLCDVKVCMLHNEMILCIGRCNHVT